MVVSSPDVKKFLYDVLQQGSFPGHMVEFVAAVKEEVAKATITPAAIVREVSASAGTAPAPMEEPAGA